MKAMYVRFPDRQIIELEITAKIDNMPSAEVMRRALRFYIKQRCANPLFRQRLQLEIERNQRILDIPS